MNDQSIQYYFVCRLHGVYCMHARAGMCKQISLHASQPASPLKQV